MKASKTIRGADMAKNGIKEKKPFYKKVWLWILVAVVVIGVAAAASGGMNNDSDGGLQQPSGTNGTNTDEPGERVVQGEETTLGAGTFTVGSDIPAGLYDVTAASGESGNFITSGGINEILGGEYGVTKVRAPLAEGEEITISSLNQVTFTPVTAAFVTDHADIELYSGKFTVGQDVGEGRYKVEPASGESGNFITSGGVNEILGGEYGVNDATVNLSDGETVTISSIETVKLTAQ